MSRTGLTPGSPEFLVFAHHMAERLRELASPFAEDDLTTIRVCNELSADYIDDLIDHVKLLQAYAETLQDGLRAIPLVGKVNTSEAGE